MNLWVTSVKNGVKKIYDTAIIPSERVLVSEIEKSDSKLVQK